MAPVNLHIASFKIKDDMNKKFSESNLIFGLTFFISLMPLTFTFSQNGTHLLLDTPFKYLVLGCQSIILLLLLLVKTNLSKKQLILLAILYLLVPITFTFTENGASFLILDKYANIILSWLIGSLLFSKLFFTSNLKEDPRQ